MEQPLWKLWLRVPGLWWQEASQRQGRVTMFTALALGFLLKAIFDHWFL